MSDHLITVNNIQTIVTAIKNKLTALAGTIPSVDATLTQSGQAADAKAAGDAIGEVKEDLNFIADDIDTISNCEASKIKVPLGDWTLGRIESGSHVTSSSYAYSEIADNTGNIWVHFDSSKYKVMFILYNENDERQTYFSWRTTSPTQLDTTTYPRFRVQVNILSGTISNNDLAGLPSAVYAAKTTKAEIVKKVLSSERSIMPVYVDSTNGADTNDGSASTPFKTIQKGVNSGAELIYVANGNYSERVVIQNRDRLTIMPKTYISSFDSGTPDSPMIHIDGGSGKSIYNAISMIDCGTINLIGIWGDNTSESVFVGLRVKNLNMINCHASNNSGSSYMGFQLNNVNGVFRDCKAWNIGVDGFNIHNYGDTQFINCTAHDCGDDGISHHDGCTGAVIGGEYYNCAKGGVATPTYGAYIDVTGVYSHDNKYGLYSSTDSSRRASKGKVNNCVFKDNDTQDVYINNCNLVGWSNIYDTKQVSGAGSFIELS